MSAGVVDEMHVMDAGRARRHAREARQTTVDMQRDLRRRRPTVLKHVLDEVDAATGRIELVAVQHVSRTGGGTKAAMHAGAQNLFQLGHIRISELREGERRLHG